MKLIEELKLDKSLLEYPSPLKKIFPITSPPPDKLIKISSKLNLIENINKNSDNLVSNEIKSKSNIEIQPKNPLMNLFDKSVNSFNFDEESQLKLKMLYDLIIPRVLLININNTKTPFLVRVVPSNLCYTHGLEYYMLEFVSIQNQTEVKIAFN